MLVLQLLVLVLVLLSQRIHLSNSSPPVPLPPSWSLLPSQAAAFAPTATLLLGVSPPPPQTSS